MANYNKSFNFRNGVQVDNDNFVVNANGLVGIGTTIPTDFLDVYGTSKFNDPIRGTDITLSGLTSTTRLRVGIVSVTSGIITAISGIVTYYGDGGKLLNLPTSQWVDVDSGFGYTSIYSRGNVGIATIYPNYTFQVGNNPDTNSGVGFNSTGNIKASGNISAYNFSGFGTDIQGINATNITNGTLNNSRLPQNITLGIITASTNFSGTLIGNLSGNVNSTGVSTFSGGISGNLTGNVNSTGVSTFSGGISGNLTGNVNSTGVSTFSGGIVGDLTGIANTARSLTGTPNISVGVITANTFTSNTGRIGIGTNAPTSDIQIIKTSGSLLEVISNSGEARISIGQTIGVGKSTGVLRFGSPSKNFDIINNDTGNLNFYLHAGEAGINTGKFVWLYGQSNNELASLGYDGNFGIGKTDPTTKLYVNGTATITGIVSFGSDIVTPGTITAGTGDNKILLGSPLGGTLKNFNLFTNGGITTVSQINVLGISSVGIGTSRPRVGLDAADQVAIFRQIGINTSKSDFNETLSVNGNTLISGILGIGTTGIVNAITDKGVLQIYGGQTLLKGNLIISQGKSATIFETQFLSEFGWIGIHTDTPISALDARFAKMDKNHRGVFYPPVLTNTERNLLSNDTLVVAGAMIYNINTLSHEAFNGAEWLPVGLSGNPNITVNNVSVGNSITIGSLANGAALIQNGSVGVTSSIIVGIATTVANVKIQSGIITTGFGVTSVSINGNTGIITATNGFASGIGTAVKITTVGNKLIFTVVGVGSTSLTLF
jgi:hypothetical protein